MAPRLGFTPYHFYPDTIRHPSPFIPPRHGLSSWRATPHITSSFRRSLIIAELCIGHKGPIHTAARLRSELVTAERTHILDAPDSTPLSIHQHHLFSPALQRSAWLHTATNLPLTARSCLFSSRSTFDHMKCTNCGSSAIDFADNQAVCSQCGVVLEESQIVSDILSARTQQVAPSFRVA